MIDVEKLRALLAAASSTTDPPGKWVPREPLSPQRELLCAAVNALPELLAIAEAAGEVDGAITVWHACGTPEGKQRFLDALLALGSAVDAARKAGA